MIVTLYSSESLRSRRHIQLVSYVAISDFFTALVYLFGNVETGSAACWIQAMVSNGFSVASIFWNVAISYQVYLIVNRQNLLSKSAMRYCHIFCWGFPFLLTFLVLSTNTFGRSDDDFDSGCFITNTGRSPKWGLLFWDLMALFVWIWISCVAIIYFYVKIGIRLYQIEMASIPLWTAAYSLFLYPLIIMLCWGVNTCILLWVDGTTQAAIVPQALGVVSVVLPALQGFFSALVFFGQNEKARAHLMGIFCCRHDRDRSEPHEGNNTKAAHLDVDADAGACSRSDGGHRMDSREQTGIGTSNPITEGPQWGTSEAWTAESDVSSLELSEGSIRIRSSDLQRLAAAHGYLRRSSWSSSKSFVSFSSSASSVEPSLNPTFVPQESALGSASSHTSQESELGQRRRTQSNSSIHRDSPVLSLRPRTADASAFSPSLIAASHTLSPNAARQCDDNQPTPGDNA